MKQIIINKVLQGNTVSDSCREITLSSSIGAINCRYYQTLGASKALILLSDLGSEWDSPSNDLYSSLQHYSHVNGISILHSQYRPHPTLNKALQDVLAVATFLRNEGIMWIGLIGHGFGAAVAIQAAAKLSFVTSVVALGTQSFGSHAVREFEKSTSLLLIHGIEDIVFSYDCSMLVHTWAKQPKQLIVHEGSGHTLNEVSDYVYDEVVQWLGATL